MNKKRLGLMLPMALAVFFGFNSCRSTDSEFDTPSITLARDTIYLEKQAGYVDIDVQSNRTWTASVSSDSAWLAVSPASGSSGTTSVRISALANDGDGAVDRTTEIIFAVGRTYSKKLIVKQSGSITRTGLFSLTFGTSATSATPYPTFAEYSDWGMSGDGFMTDSTKVTGTGSVRQPTTRLSSGYANASAGSHAYLSNSQNIIVSKIDTKGANLFDITFGVSAYDGTSSNTFTIGQVDLFVSPNGTDWTPVSYTYEATPLGLATWGICSATCGIPEGSQRLYVKVAANANSGWQLRVDDITVLSRGSGAYNVPTVTTGEAGSITDTSAILNGTFTAPEGVTVTETGIQYKIAGGTYTEVASALPTAVFSISASGLTPGSSYYYRAYAKVGTSVYYGSVASFNTASQAIYAENMGATAVSATTTIAAHTGWQKGGTGGANVTYEGTADIRTTSASPTASGYSGGNSVFFSTLPRTFIVKNINISGHTNFILALGMGHFAANVLTTDMTIEGSLDGGSTWGPITYNVTTGTDWQKATGEFSVPANSTNLALRFTANIASVMRIDDITLNEGGSGAVIVPVIPPADTLKNIAFIRSLKSNLEGKGTPTTTAGQEYTVGAYRIKGRVVSKYDGTQSLYGNLNNRSIAIQDSNLANSGICIRLASATKNTFALGDQVEAVLTGGKMSYYAGQLQIALASDDSISKTTASNSPVSPTTITYADLATGNYECMYVAMEQVQATIDFADGLKTMYNTTHLGSVIMENQAGNHFLMYSSSKVPFGTVVIPTGSGTLKGLGGIYVGTETNYQVQPQVESDFSGLTGTRFGAAGTLTYGTPFFKGNIKVGTAITNASIAIPYTYGAGQIINAGVAVSGVGAAGIDSVSTQSFTLGTGADTLYIPITGTPTTEGAVTFTIKGITLTTNTASTTVGPSGTGNEVVLYSTGFESSEGFTASTTYNNATEAVTGSSGSTWGTVYGTPSTTGFISGAQSMQMRWYTTAATTLGYTYTKFTKSKVTKVTFKALNTNGLNVIVKYSTDGGNNWTGAQTFTLGTTAPTDPYTYSINASGVDNVQIRFEITYTTAPTATSRVTLDDVKIYGFE